MKRLGDLARIAYLLALACFSCGNSERSEGTGAGGTGAGGSGGMAGAAGSAGAAGTGGAAGTVNELAPGATFYMYDMLRQLPNTFPGLDLDGRGGPLEAPGHCKPSVPYDEADLTDGPQGVDNAYDRFFRATYPWNYLEIEWQVDLAIPVLHVSLEGGIPVAAGVMAATASAQNDVFGADDGTVPIEVYSDTVDGNVLKPLMRTSDIQNIDGRYVVRFATPLVIAYTAGPVIGGLTIHDPVFAFPKGADLSEIEMRYVTLAGWLEPAEFKAESEYILRSTTVCELPIDPNTVADLEIGSNTGTCNALSFGVELLGNRVTFGQLVDRPKRDPPGECVPGGF